MKKNGWVFISHSHRDIDAVRRIRNKFESLGYEPLLFFLKCLSDEDEIAELIKREIDEREWFVYADSPNARRSKWVQTERDYIETVPGKKIFAIDLSASLEDQMKAVEHMARQMKVYIAASRRDYPLVEALSRALTAHDMRVLTDETLAVGDFFLNTVREEIGEASRDGFVLLVVSEHTASSELVLREAEMALASGGKILPVYVGKASLPQALVARLGTTVGISLSECPTDAELQRAIDMISSRVTYYDSDYTTSQGFRYARRITLPPLSRLDADTFALCEALEEVTIPPSVIYIDSATFEGLGDILIRCYPDSYAERFCKIHLLRYELIGETV